jgi:GGDEF domain-containing protein
VRGVARTLANCFRRASDVLVRAGEGRFFALAASLTPEQATGHARLLTARIRNLHLHHPRAPGERLVTVSVGLGHGVPLPAMTPTAMLARACEAADAAGQSGSGQVSVAALRDG